MRAHILPVLFAVALFGSTARAEQFQPGQDVIVNPSAAGPTRLLLYPGGEYLRLVRPLHHPGDNQVIHLHMPVHHRIHAVRRKVKPAQDLAETAPLETPPAETPRPVRHRKPAPAPAPASAPDNGFTDFTPAPDTSLQVTQVPPPKPPSRRVARATPPPAQTAAPATAAASAGLTKHSTILFAAGAPDPAANVLGAIKFLAGDLNVALENGNSRIQILAFGGAKGDKSTDARRLSLKRALSIRQVLIDDGVSADRIDVRAMGGADDGPPDRVDIYIKS